MQVSRPHDNAISYGKTKQHNAHFITVSGLNFDRKPTSSEAGKITNWLNSNPDSRERRLTPKAFLSIVTSGHTFCPAIFEGKRNNSNWEAQGIFCIDIDEGQKPETVINNYKSYGITPNVFYWTYSANPTKQKYNYRLAFFLDQMIYKRDLRDAIQQGLITIAGCADEGCKDASRFFYGGTDGQVIANETLKLNDVRLAIQNINVTNDSNQLRAMDTRLDQCAERTDHIGEGLQNTGYSYSNTYNVTRPTAYNMYVQSTYKGLMKFRHNNNFNFKDIFKVKIVRDFRDGQYIHYPELKGLATNLYYLRKKRWMINTMNKWNAEGRTNYQDKHFNMVRAIAKTNKQQHNGHPYLPETLENFSPYPEDHKYHNLIDAVDGKKGKVRTKKQFKGQPLSKARKQMNNEIQQFRNDDNPNALYIFKASCGLGKTYSYKGIEGALIAIPNHRLKGKISDKMQVDHTCTPDKPKFNNKDYNDTLKAFENAGLSNHKYQFIKKIASKATTEDAVKAKQFLSENHKTYQTDKTVLTTHFRGVHTQFGNKKSIIFDEEPIETLLSVDSIRLKELAKITVLDSSKESKMLNILRYFDNIPEDDIRTRNFEDVNPESVAKKLIAHGISMDILSVLNADYYICNTQKTNGEEVKHIHYLKKNALPKKKIAIMSATANPEFYRKLYPNRDIKVIDLTADLKGEVIQYTGRSYSRSSLERALNNGMPKYPDIPNGLPVITFKEFTDKIKNAKEDVYIGNLQGYNDDDLKGKDFIIQATPQPLPQRVFLYAHALGITTTKEDREFRCRKCENKYNSFKMHCYKNEHLRNIQFHFIQSELRQAIGRGRLIYPENENAKVYLLSNYPMPESSKYIPE